MIRKYKSKNIKTGYNTNCFHKPNSNVPFAQGTVDYVALLRKFISVEGKILHRRFTGLTAKEQRHIATAIKTARLLVYPLLINKLEPNWEFLL
jgi:small subunit ribosomal protein S18